MYLHLVLIFRHSLHLPLINQLITKYKERIAPFLGSVFVSVVQTINKCLNEPCDPSDMEVRYFARTPLQCYIL